MFLKDDSQPWLRDHQKDPIAEACELAKIKPVNFHVLRHTWASHAVMNGVPLLLVAKNMGHKDTRMGGKTLWASRAELRDRCHSSGRAALWLSA
jgi:integrase